MSGGGAVPNDDYRPDADEIAAWLGDYTGAVVPGRPAVARVPPAKAWPRPARPTGEVVRDGCGGLALLSFAVGGLLSGVVASPMEFVEVVLLLLVGVYGVWSGVRGLLAGTRPRRRRRRPGRPRHELVVDRAQMAYRTRGRTRKLAWADLVAITAHGDLLELHLVSGGRVKVPALAEFGPALAVAERVVEQRRAWEAAQVARMERGLSRPEATGSDRGISLARDDESME